MPVAVEPLKAHDDNDRNRGYTQGAIGKTRCQETAIHLVVAEFGHVGRIEQRHVC